MKTILNIFCKIVMTIKKIIYGTSIGILVLLLVIFIVLDGCTMVKAYSLIKKGEVEQKDFKTTFPFEFDQGLIIIKVKIKGKEYDFMLDTGAPNLISKEIADELMLKPKFSAEMDDSQNQSEELDFVQIEHVSIGGVNFLNMGAVVADLENGVKKVSCFKVDGIIGANLMRNAIWDIDYETQNITITSAKSLLDITNDNEKIPFTTSLTGSPFIQVGIGGELIKKVQIDLGMTSDFKFSNSTFQTLLKKKQIISTISGNGTLSGSVFGYAEPERDDFALVKSLQFGEISLKNQVVTFIDDEKTTKIGTMFLKNYRVILNWFKKEMTLIKKRDYRNSTFETFGFKSAYRENGKIVISYIYSTSNAYKAGLRYGDEIIELDGNNYRNISLDEWCELKDGLNKNDSVSISILRNGEKLTFNLDKTDLLKSS